MFKECVVEVSEFHWLIGILTSSYQSACIRGDYSLALHSLDRFYNYRFPGHDKCVPLE
jgi:hypothetical protein